MSWVLLIFGMEFPGLVALADCYQRSPDRFAGGARDRSAWFKWLVIALFLTPVGIGYGILLGYHWNVIKRHGSMAPVNTWRDDDEWEPKDSRSE
ncbi:MAG: hypothetical protein QOJ00_2174 [Actinomycetota bacterium]|jgi:hypothetical protein